MKKFKTFPILFLLSLEMSFGQVPSQTIRGTVIDQDTQTPLIGATIYILDSNPMMGDVSDLRGNFKIVNVPLGRVSLTITYEAMKIV